MSKALTTLEALEEIANFGYTDDWDELHYLKDGYRMKEKLDIIEKSLKALEIIKSNSFHVLCRAIESSNYKEFINEVGESDLTQEEYDLLKEVLL